jgi:hypothetical protein
LNLKVRIIFIFSNAIEINGKQEDKDDYEYFDLMPVYYQNDGIEILKEQSMRGQHTSELLREFGIEKEDIIRLTKKRAKL